MRAPLTRHGAGGRAARRGGRDHTPASPSLPTCLSPTYGYGLEWDDAVWTVDDESSSRGVATLVLESDFGTATFVGSDDYAGDVVDRYDDLESTIGEKIPDLTIFQPEGQDPLPGSDAGVVSMQPAGG
jgi:hypothetical protein